MLFIKLTRANAIDGVYQHALIAGPFDDDVDARYTMKQLKAGDSNRDSAYELSDCKWVVVLKRGEQSSRARQGEVISWHETEDDCKHHAAAAQRSDYTAVVEPMTYQQWLELK